MFHVALLDKLTSVLNYIAANKKNNRPSIMTFTVRLIQYAKMKQPDFIHNLRRPGANFSVQNTSIVSMNMIHEDNGNVLSARYGIIIRQCLLNDQ